MRAANLIAIVFFTLSMIGTNCANCTTGTGTLSCTNITTVCMNITKKCTNTSTNCTNNTYSCTNTTGICANFTSSSCTNFTNSTNISASCTNTSINCTNGTINCTNVTSQCSNITKKCANVTCPCNNATCINSPIAGCSIIDINNTFGFCNNTNCGCLSCNNTYGMGSNHTCISCNSLIPNCFTCLNASSTVTCSSCKPTYSVNSTNQCQLCTTRLIACINCDIMANNCQNCNSSYFLNQTTLQCQICNSTLQFCQNCSDFTTCVSCTLYYGFDLMNRCVLCSDYLNNCSQCRSIDNCTVCVNDSNIVMVNSSYCVTCQQAIIYCSSCNGNSTCLNCNESYMGVNYTSIPNVCVLCNASLPNCLFCLNYTFCLDCDNTTFLSFTDALHQHCTSCEASLMGCSLCQNRTFCLTCIDNGLYLYNEITHTCVPCHDYIAFCSTCLPTFQCLTCYDNRYVLTVTGNTTVCLVCAAFMNSCQYCNSNSTCLLCLIGRQVPDKNGCTNTIGCVKVNAPFNPNNSCLACDSQIFLLQPQNGTCACIQGWIIGNYCTTVIGCTALVRINKTTECIACNFTKNFILKNRICVCPLHYNLSNDTCIQVCGDGYAINHPCDDGNLIDEDGCSSTCQIEPNHICENSYNKYPSSKCYLRAKVELTLKKIQKNSANTAKITFNIQPYGDKLRQMDLLSLVNLTTQGSNVVDIDILNNQLVVQIQFNKSIDHQNAQLTMKFDHQYVKSPSTTITFQMIQSTGVPLTNTQQDEMNVESTNMLVVALSLLSLSVFVLGSVAFKMIGVETLFTVQISWMILATSQQYNISFIMLQKLYYSYGQISRFSGGSKLIAGSFSKLGYTNNLSENYLLLAILNVLAILLYLAATIYRLRLQTQIQTCNLDYEFEITLQAKKMKKVRERKINKMTKYMNIMYNWAIFPLFIGFFMHLLHTNYVNSLNRLERQTSFYYSLNILLTFMATSIIFYSQLLKKGQTQDQIAMLKNPQQNSYIPYFLVHNLMVFILISLKFTNNMLIINILVVALIFLHTLYLIVKRPYQRNLNNFSIIFNQFIILLSIIWISAQAISIDISFLSGILVYAFMGLILVVNILGAVRSIVSLRQGNLINNQTIDKKPKKKGFIDQMRFSPSKFEIQQTSIFTMMLSHHKSLVNKRNQLIQIKRAVQRDQTINQQEDN